MYNRLLEFILLGIWLCVAVVVYVQNDFAKSGFYTINESLNLSNNEIEIKNINLIDDNLFEITLKNGLCFRTIVGEIEVDSVDPNEVKRLFNSADNLKAVLIHKQSNDTWLLKINFNLEGKKISLKNWLSDRGLLKK